MYDTYSNKCHNLILELLKTHQFLNNLPQHDPKTLKPRLTHPGSAILSMINGSESTNHLNISMARLAIAVIRYQTEHPEDFPTARWDRIEPDVLMAMELLASKCHAGFHPYEFALFYCGMIVVLNITTGIRIKLDHMLSDGQHFQIVPKRQRIEYDGQSSEFHYDLSWLPTQGTTGPPPADDIFFESAKHLAHSYAQKEETTCAITELSFGFVDIRTRILVVFTDPTHTKPFPKNYFRRPYVHCTEGIQGLNCPGTVPTAKHKPPSKQDPDHPPAGTARAAMARLILAGFNPDDHKPEDLRLERSKYLARLNSLAYLPLNETDEMKLLTPTGTTRLFHGASISVKDEIGRASFGLYLECDGWDGPVFVTAGLGGGGLGMGKDEKEDFGSSTLETSVLESSALDSSALNPSNLEQTASEQSTLEPAVLDPSSLPRTTLVQSPGGLDMIQIPLKTMMPNPEFRWALDDNEAEDICSAEFARRKIVGEVLHSDIGAEPGFGWRIDYSIVNSTLAGEAPKNGFSHLSKEGLKHLASKVFQDYDSEDLPDSEWLWWLRASETDLLSAFGSITDTKDPNYNGNDRVFKAGASTGVTTGFVNGRGLYHYMKGTAQAIPTNDVQMKSARRGSNTVDACMLTIVFSQKRDLSQPSILSFLRFCGNGDSGSAVMKLVREGSSWKLVWKGMVVSGAYSAKLSSSLGLMVSASGLVEMLWRETGERFRVVA